MSRALPLTGGSLAVRWFDSWDPSLDEVLGTLPELETCPHELYRMLLVSPARTRKRIALVSADGQPVALAGLLRRKWFWQPVADGVNSIRQAMPAREGYLFAALAALGVDVWTGGYEIRPPLDAPTRRCFPLPTYRISCRGDYEGYWREAGSLKTVRQARARTRGFTLEVDAPGAAAWVIRSWDQKWMNHPAMETIAADDQILAAQYYQRNGRLHSLRLLLDGAPVAGHNFYVHGRSLVYTCTYRDMRYESKSVGTRLLDLSFQWAAESDFDMIDLGSGHSYKQRWAPEDGARWYANVCPLHIYVPKQAARLARAGVRAAKDRALASFAAHKPRRSESAS